jgi:hypothetical protein
MTRTWIGGVVLAGWAMSVAGRTPAVEVPIVVYDSAGVGPKTLSAAESITSKILFAAGLDARWSAGPVSDVPRLGLDFTARTPAECAGAADPQFLRVQLIAHAPAALPAPAIALSLPCARAGIQVIIYTDRVAKVSEANAPTFGRVLAYTMAHELGHVLLHSAEHEDGGLMKALWSKSDWQRAAVSIVSFSPAQSRQIMGALRKTGTSEIAQLSPLYER